MAAYGVARRFKAPGGRMPYADVTTIRTAELDRFIVDPTHPMPGPNI